MKILFRVPLLILFLPASMAPAQAVATITTLAVTAGGVSVSAVAPGTVITLTATVTAGGAAVTPGQVNFCDATAKACSDVHLLGTQQLTSSGTAVLKFVLGAASTAITRSFWNKRRRSKFFGSGIPHRQRKLSDDHDHRTERRPGRLYADGNSDRQQYHPSQRRGVVSGHNQCELPTGNDESESWWRHVRAKFYQLIHLVWAFLFAIWVSSGGRR